MLRSLSLLLSPLHRWLVSLLVAPILVCGMSPSAMAAPLTQPTTSAPLNQTVTEVVVSLGNEANELKFVPDTLEFVAGKRYKLLLSNPSTQKHYFTAKDFADNLWTQKVEAGKVEIKGAIHDLELKPGAQAEWLFIPIKPGSYELHCSVTGHTEAGMKGTIQISSGSESSYPSKN